MYCDKYYLSHKGDRLTPWDKETLPNLNIDFTLSNLLFRTSSISQYVEDKLLLNDMKEFDLDRHII